MDGLEVLYSNPLRVGLSLLRRFSKLKSSRIQVNVAEQLPERDPIVWVHKEALNLDGKPWLDFRNNEMSAVGAEMTASRLNLSSYGVQGKNGRTYRIQVANNSSKSVMVENVAINVTNVYPSPSGTLVFQTPQGQPDEREFWCDITSTSTDRQYAAMVADEMGGGRPYRNHPNLCLESNEVAQLFIQISAPDAHVFEFDVVLDLGDFGKIRIRNKDTLRLVTIPHEAERVYTVRLKQEPEETSRLVLEGTETIEEAQEKFFT